MPPISTGSARPFGVTIRFAPRLRSSRFTRSPISSITPSIAVATAEPMATAATVMALRRGERRIDWLTKRRNMSARGTKDSGSGQQLGGGNDELVALHARFDRYRIASARGADRGHINGRRTVLAKYVRAVLVIALVTADRARVESRGQRLVRTADDDH